LRADKRIGEISREPDKEPRGVKPKLAEKRSSNSKQKTLVDAGIEPRVANSCEAIAAEIRAEARVFLGSLAVKDDRSDGGLGTHRAFANSSSTSA
jgi:hypothetical protein